MGQDNSLCTSSPPEAACGVQCGMQQHTSILGAAPLALPQIINDPQLYECEHMCTCSELSMTISISVIPALARSSMK